MPHILIVCTANICRSPVGELVLRDRLEAQGFENWQVSSAGTWAQLARSAAQVNIDLMAEQGFDLSQHRAQMVTEAHLAEADLILCMTSSHAEALRAEFPQHADRIYLMSEMIGHRFDVLDPYGGPRDGYERMIKEVSGLVDDGLARIIELAQRPS